MKKFTLILCAAAFLLSGCGDNGPLPTLMGRQDYTFNLPAGWLDTHSGTLQVLLNSVMSDSAVTEHMLLKQQTVEGQSPTFLTLSSNRGGPYTEAIIRRQMAEYLDRPVKKKPLRVVSSLDVPMGKMTVESYHENVVFLTHRIYTKKGYIQSDCMSHLNDPETIAEAKSIMASLTPASSITLR